MVLSRFKYCMHPIAGFDVWRSGRPNRRSMAAWAWENGYMVSRYLKGILGGAVQRRVESMNPSAQKA